MALVDPNIALSYRGIQLQDPLEQYNKASAAQLNALKMDELMQERDALSQIRSAITAKGGPPDLEAAAQAMVSTGRPQFVQSGMAILEKLQNQKNYEQYRRDIEGAPAPANALAPAAATAETPPANALVAPRAAAAPTVSPQTQELMNRIRRVSQLGEVGKPEAAILKMQLENQLRAEASDRMLTPEQEAQKIRIAQSSRPSSLLTPEEEAQKVRLAQASRQDRLLTPEEEAQKIRIAGMTRPVQNINLPPQEKAEQSDRGKLLVEQYKGISDAARIGARSLPALQSNIATLDKGFETGFGTPAKAAAASVLAALGVKDAEKYATNAQTFLGNASAAILQRQLEQKGPQTEADAQRITQTGAQLGNTKEANKFLINVAKAQINRDIDQRNFYDRWWKTNKTYDGAEDAWYAGEGGKSLFERPELKSAAQAPSLINQIPTGRAPAPAAARPQAVKPTAAPTPIPQAAIDALKAKKGTPEQFDEIFGAGAAKRVLGGK